MVRFETQQERTGSSEERWYEPARRACFNSLADAAFLRLLAAPMCVPANRNFGRRAEERTGGRGSGEGRSREEILQEQRRVLDAYGRNLRECGCLEGETAPDRAEELPGILTAKIITGKDWIFSGKWDNYKAKHYLSMFLRAEAPGQIMEQVTEYYIRLTERLFEGLRGELKSRYEILKEEVGRTLKRSALPPVPAEYANTMAEKMGWTLCASLLLLACERCGEEESAAVAALLEVDISAPRPPEKGPGKAGSVTLKWGQFRALCAAALRGEQSLEELRLFTRLLGALRSRAEDEGELRELTVMLLDRLRCTVSDCASRVAAEPENARRLLDDATEAQSLCEECQSWLE